MAQCIGSAAVTAATFGVGMALMYAVKATGTLRVSREGELEGLDIHEHGGPAYPELSAGLQAGGCMSKEPSEIPASGLVAAK